MGALLKWADKIRSATYVAEELGISFATLRVYDWQGFVPYSHKDTIERLSRIHKCDLPDVEFGAAPRKRTGQRVKPDA